MKEKNKYLLEELNYSFADGFTRGYNRGFMDGMRMAAQVRVELTEQIEGELNDTETKTRGSN